MTTGAIKTTDEAQIRAIVDRRVRAVQAKDVAGATADHAPDIVLYDAVPPLQYVGLDQARERIESWFALYDGPIRYEIRDLSVAAGDAAAFCHYLYRVTGTLEAGAKVDMWVRATLCLRNVDGVWKVTHEHDSVPFDSETRQALFDLKP